MVDPGFVSVSEFLGLIFVQKLQRFSAQYIGVCMSVCD